MSLPLLAELQRRRVFRALVGYGIAAFAVLQIIEPVMHGLHWSEAVLTYVVVALAIGFPLVVGLAWIFDVNAGRIERTPGQPLRAHLVLVLALIGAVAAAPGIIWYFAIRARPTAAEPPSIAVLPFADMSPGKDQEYFSDGIAEEILNALAQVEGLRVAGRTSSFSFKGKSEDLGAIAQKLHVAHLLEGSVRKEGNHLRITAQLIAAADGYHVWSKTFDRELTGVFAVQDEIAKAIVEALRLKLLPGKARVTNPEAYAQYLLGTQLMRDTIDMPPRIAAFEKAIALDPDYAPAWAKLAIVVRSYLPPGETPERKAARRRRAMEAAEKSVALDPTLAEGYATRALLRQEFLWNWDEARSDYERAVSLNPGDSRAQRNYGWLLAILGRGSEGIRLQRHAIDLDPLLFTNWSWLGQTYLNQRQYTLARSAWQRTIELANPRFDEANLGIGWSYLFEGQVAQAAAWWDKLEDGANRLLAKAALAHARGQPGQADVALAALIAKAGPTHPYWIAQLYALRGDKRYAELLKKMNLPPD